MSSPLTRAILAGLLGRLTLNVGFRMAYPFLPIIARGLGVALEAAATLVAARSAMGFASLAVGPLADRYRRRTLILAALVLFMAGALVAAVWPQLAPFTLGFLAMGLAKVIFDPTVQAYLSDRLPYSTRGRVFGLLELPWAAAGLVGLPLVGWAIARWGWQAPFWGLAALGAASSLGARWGFAAGDRAHAPTTGRLWSSYAVAWRARSVRWALLMMVCLMLANEALFIVYGAWLEGEFGLGAAALGSVSIATGLAEFTGEGLSSAVLDRVGKKRALLVSQALLAAAYLALPGLGRLGLVGAVAGLTLLLLVFEFALISCIPLISELAPRARGTTLGLNIAAMQTGRVLGAVAGPLVWRAAGLPGSVALAAALTVIAWLSLAFRVHENVMRET